MLLNYSGNPVQGVDSPRLHRRIIYVKVYTIIFTWKMRALFCNFGRVEDACNQEQQAAGDVLIVVSCSRLRQRTRRRSKRSTPHFWPTPPPSRHNNATILLNQDGANNTRDRFWTKQSGCWPTRQQTRYRGRKTLSKGLWHVPRQFIRGERRRRRRQPTAPFWRTEPSCCFPRPRTRPCSSWSDQVVIYIVAQQCISDVPLYLSIANGRSK